MLKNEEKKAQGRQPMTEEQKAEAKIKREEQKKAAELKKQDDIKTLAASYKTKESMAEEILKLQEKILPPLKLKIASEDIESITVKQLNNENVLTIKLFDSSLLQIAYTASEEANQAAETVKQAIPQLKPKIGKKRASFKLG